MPNPSKKYIPEIAPGVTGLPAKPFLSFLHVFLDDMGIGESQINGCSVEPIMAEYFLDRCERDALLQCQGGKSVPDHMRGDVPASQLDKFWQDEAGIYFFEGLGKK